MKRNISGILLGLALSAMWLPHAHSAELVKANSPLCDLKLQGTIEPGDFRKLEGQLEWGMRLCLNSPGGSYIDGVELFAHIATGKIRTAVDAFDVCLSACAIAFMGGSFGDHVTRVPDRTLHVSARLGFHSPFLKSGATDMPVPRDALQFGVSVGISVVAKLLRADTYNLLSRLLIADMLETSPTSMYYVDTLQKARDLRVNLAGVKEPEKITRAMLYQACINSDPWGGDAAAANAGEAKQAQRRVVEKDNRCRIEFGGFGMQGMAECVIDVISMPGRGRELHVEVEGVKQPIPVWYLYPASLTLSDMVSMR